MRQLLPEDADRLAELENELFEENAMNERTLRAELELGGGWGSGEPLHGYVLYRDKSGLRDITRLGVLPKMRGKGLANRLLLQASQGASKVMLCVRKTNRHAIALYTKHGFKIVGVTDLSWVMIRT